MSHDLIEKLKAMAVAGQMNLSGAQDMTLIAALEATWNECKSWRRYMGATYPAPCDITDTALRQLEESLK